MQMILPGFLRVLFVVPCWHNARKLCFAQVQPDALKNGLTEALREPLQRNKHGTK